MQGVFRRGFSVWIGMGALSLMVSACSTSPRFKPPAEEASPAPMFAVWLRSDGMRLVKDQKAPSLRFAIWEDGRVIRADDPKTWGSSLREGRLSPEQVTELKVRLAGSGVFALKRTNAAVPDAPLHAMLVHVEGRRQILHWDERETSNYGINISPNADDLEFIRCWKSLNRAGTTVKPQGLKRVGDSFVFEPRSWVTQGS